MKNSFLSSFNLLFPPSWDSSKAFSFLLRVLTFCFLLNLVISINLTNFLDQNKLE